MSKLKNRKTLAREALDELPVPLANERIVRVIGMRSGNIVDVVDASAFNFLCRVPNKFNKMIWIKRGAALLHQPVAESQSQHCILKS
jgi:hypothetical protein